MGKPNAEKQQPEGQGKQQALRPLYVRVGKQADAVTGLSNATRWRMEQAGQFPKRRKIGGCSGYLYSELEEYFGREV